VEWEECMAQGRERTEELPGRREEGCKKREAGRPVMSYSSKRANAQTGTARENCRGSDREKR